MKKLPAGAGSEGSGGTEPPKDHDCDHNAEDKPNRMTFLRDDRVGIWQRRESVLLKSRGRSWRSRFCRTRGIACYGDVLAGQLDDTGNPTGAARTYRAIGDVIDAENLAV